MKVFPTPLFTIRNFSLYYFVCFSFRCFYLLFFQFLKMFIIKIVYLGHVPIQLDVHINTPKGFYIGYFSIRWWQLQPNYLAIVWTLDIDATDLLFSFHFIFNDKMMETRKFIWNPGMPWNIRDINEIICRESIQSHGVHI